MTQQVHGSRNAFWELMDLSDPSLQVDGPPVHFTLTTITQPKMAINTQHI
jgi:hypothetical protein